MASPPLNVLYYGREDPPPEQHELRAGHLSAAFEQGQLLNIRWRGQEVLHRIYAAVRDRDWGTVPVQISNLSILEWVSTFAVTFDARHQETEIDFAWKGRIEGGENGRLSFSMEGEALSTFLRSRIGFCVLHWVDDCAGKPFSALRPDGSEAKGVFPGTIALDAPIPGTEAMTALRYEISCGLELSVRFEGDVFQMEDQRAWTDATFKSFCTPLELPCPAEIQRGTKVRQAVRFSLNEHRPHAVASSAEKQIVTTLGREPAGKIPEIGLGLATDVGPVTRWQIDRLRALNIAHLRADLNLGDPDWRARFERASLEARELGCGLELVLFLSDSAERELSSLLEALQREQPRVLRWLIFHTSEDPISERYVLLARSSLAPWNSGSRFGSGTNAYFYQLARFRPASGLDFICFSIQPQEHSSDNASILETLQMQAVVVDNARRLFDSRPVSITPVTLKPRFNPNATGSQALSSLRPSELPMQVEARQMSLLGACWTLGSVKYLSESGAQSVTYYETTGWRGVMERDAGSPIPAQFPSMPGAVFPLYHVLADVGEFAGGQVLRCSSSEPLKAECIALSKKGKRRVLLGNMTSQVFPLSVHDLPDDVQVKVLDERTARDAMVHPEEYRKREGQWRSTSGGELTIELRPYAIVRIDGSDD